MTLAGVTAEAPDRTCGSCKACCTALSVTEVPKAEWQRCPKLGPIGCKVYSKRPESCRVYLCGWLAGYGDRFDRPDRLGAIFSLMTSEDLGDHVMVHELRDGALAQERVRKTVEILARTLVVFHIQRDSMRHLLGGPEDQLHSTFDRARDLGMLTVNGAPLAPDVTTEQFIASLRRFRTVSSES